MTVHERLWNNTNVQENGCWEFSKLGNNGYGHLWVKSAGRQVSTHVLGWELLNGPVPDGLELDHLCRNRACWNPAHLEPVTHAENIRRGEWRNPYTNSLVCRNGHKRTDTNTRKSRRQLVCIDCERDTKKRYLGRWPKRG